MFEEGIMAGLAYGAIMCATAWVIWVLWNK